MTLISNIPTIRHHLIQNVIHYFKTVSNKDDIYMINNSHLHNIKTWCLSRVYFDVLHSKMKRNRNRFELVFGLQNRQIRERKYIDVNVKCDF